VLHCAKEDVSQRSMDVLGNWRIFKHPAANKHCNGRCLCRISSILKPSKLLLFNSVSPVWFTLLMRNTPFFTSASLLKFQFISHIKKELVVTSFPSRQVFPPGLVLHGL